MEDVGPTFDVWPIGHVESALTDLDAAPRQADEGAPDAVIVVGPSYLDRADAGARHQAGARVGRAALIAVEIERQPTGVLVD